VLRWRLCNTMDVSFCADASEDALAKYGTPAIFNTDQGSQFTSAAFTGVLERAGILKGYADGRELHEAISGDRNGEISN
jgi:transposase InsO family protein